MTRAISSLHIRKWYFDCTTSAGDAAIVYVGDLSFGGVHASYVEVIAKIGVGLAAPVVLARRWSGRAAAAITQDEHSLSLSIPALGVVGRWSLTTRGVAARLFDGSSGRIDWRAVQPAGDAHLSLPSGSTLVGAGYVEELTMSVRPWALPFHELRWGRFIGGGRSVVWVDWRGGVKACWVFVDGAAVEGRVSDDRVEWPGGWLAIDSGQTIRDAAIGRTVAGPCAFLLPRRIRRATETKRISPGRLHDSRGTIADGWIIHEVVRCP